MKSIDLSRASAEEVDAFMDEVSWDAVDHWCHSDMAVYSRFCFDPGAGIHYGGYAGMWVREYPVARGWAP